MLKELAAAAASRLRAPKLRALQAFHVQCSSLTSAGVALCANGRHPLLLRGLPATKALPGVPRKAPLCSLVYYGVELVDLADDSSCRHTRLVPMRALLLAAALPGGPVAP